MDKNSYLCSRFHKQLFHKQIFYINITDTLMKKIFFILGIALAMAKGTQA